MAEQIDQMQADRSIASIPVRVQSASFKALDQPFWQSRATDRAACLGARGWFIGWAGAHMPVAWTVEQFVQGQSRAIPRRFLAGNHALQIKDYQDLQLNI